MTAEVRQLVTALDGIRAGVLKKLSGLDEADARRTTAGSGTTLAGLVQHLTFVESLWFEEIVGGGVATRATPTADSGSARRGCLSVVVCGHWRRGGGHRRATCWGPALTVSPGSVADSESAFLPMALAQICVTR